MKPLFDYDTIEKAISAHEAARPTETTERWALRRMLAETLGSDIKHSRENNAEFFDRAEAFVAGFDYIGAMRLATQALDANDKETYARLETVLGNTSPIDTQEVRRRLAADMALSIDTDDSQQYLD